MGISKAPWRIEKTVKKFPFLKKLKWNLVDSMAVIRVTVHSMQRSQSQVGEMSFL